MERERLAARDDRVSGVGAALVAAHDVRVLGEQVDDLALPFVAPLCADDYGGGHQRGGTHGSPTDPLLDC